VGAQEAERRAIMQAMSGDVLRPASRGAAPTLEDSSVTFLDNYAASHKPSTQLAKRQILRRHLVPHLGHLPIDQIRQVHVDKLVADLLRGGLSRKTINNITSVLSALLRYAVKNKVIESCDLTFNIKAQSVEVVAVPAESVTRLVEACTDPRYRAAFLLAADAGLRVGEIRALRWPDVNMIGREITVSRSLDRNNALTETKGYDTRVIPISDRLWAALRQLDDSRRHVLYSRSGDAPLRYDGVRERILDAYKAAKVTPPPRPWHSLRHTFCTELARAGVPVNVIKELAGHKSIETTLRYMHTDRAAKRGAIDALAHEASERDSASTSRR